MQSLRLLALYQNYDSLLVTGTRLNGNSPDDAVAIPGYQSFRKSRLLQLGCLVNVRNFLPDSLF